MKSEFRRAMCPVQKAAGLSWSSPPGLKRSQVQQSESVQMALAGHQLPRALALPLVRQHEVLDWCLETAAARTKN